MGGYSEKYIFCHFILGESLSLFSASQNQEKYNKEIFQNMRLIVCSHSQQFFFLLKKCRTLNLNYVYVCIHPTSLTCPYQG